MKRPLIASLFSIVLVSLILIGINYFLIQENPLAPKPVSTQAPSLMTDLARAPGPSRRKLEEAKKLILSDPPRAKVLLDQAIDLDSNNANALSELAKIHLNEGDRQRARDFATDCLDIDSKHTECNQIMINSYLRYGEFEQADRYLSDCLVDDPSNIHCMGGKLTVYLSRDRIGDAKTMLKQMRENAPSSIWTNLASAQIFEREGNIIQARKYYRKACDANQAFACSRLQALAPTTESP